VTDNVILKVRNLDVHYGDFQALWDISIEVGKGKVVSIIGANGSGKSTLLNTISGLLKPSHGAIEFLGESINNLGPHEMVARGISLVPEGRRLFPSLTVFENLIIGSYAPRSRKKRDSALGKVYELFPILKERASQMSDTLSGGEQQMLAIARALMSDPSLILFDEISLGLAPLIIKNIYQKVREINQQGITVVLVEQDVKRSLKAASMAYIMLEGKVVLQGEPSTLSEKAVRKAYFGL
jgi:branched-chain amino acid transport system ATP-binding protein